MTVRVWDYLPEYEAERQDILDAVETVFDSGQLVLGASYSYRDGEFDSACTPGNVAKVIAREGSNMKAIAVDDIFGGCVYRLEGHAHTGELHLNYGLGNRFSVDLGYRYVWGQARELIYRSNVASVAVLFRY